MANKLLKPTVETNMFGTKLVLDGGKVLADNLEFDPLAGRNTRLKDGYMFRHPGCQDADVSAALAHLEYVAGGYNWYFRQRGDDGKETMDGYIIIADKIEATMFAVSHMASWQKWSRAQELEEAKERRRGPNKLMVTKDGKVKARVTVSTISDL